MKRGTLLTTILLALLAALLALPGKEASRPSTSGAPAQQWRVQLPVSFEANRGQALPDIDFLSRNKGYTIALNATEARLSLSRPVAQHETSARSGLGAKAAAIKTARDNLSFKLVGANAAAPAKGLEELPGKVNYFTGNDPHTWRERVPTYAKVQYQNVYPGIDLIYYGSSHSAGRLEYDFIVHPNAEVDAIKMNFAGVEKIDVDARGDLVMHTPENPHEIRFHKPVAYQEAQGERREITGSYTIAEENLVAFHVGEYDESLPLVIDPVLSYSTYLGGSGDDVGLDIAVDASGNIYVAGFTVSNDFPVSPSAFQRNYRHGVCGVEPDTFATADVFVAKLSADGSSLVYATYFGGTGNDIAQSLAVDASGNVIVSGITNSTDFPLANALRSTFGGGSGECLSGDAFVAKLNAGGTALIYSTYLGGSNDDFCSSVALDASGNAYLTGWTQSSDWPTSNAQQDTFGGGARDAFIAKLNSTGSAWVYSTFLGGSETDEAYAIAVDASNNVYVTGMTQSVDFPKMNARQNDLSGLQDAFVTKLQASGSALAYSTYHGGGGDESGNGIGVDRSGNAYVAGVTSSSDDFPAMNPFQPNFSGGEKDAFVSMFSPDGASLLYSTYLGGTDDDFGNALAVDLAGNACVWGFTFSSDFPIANAVQDASAGGMDAFLSVFNAAGDTTFSTYLGGADFDQGFGLALDDFGNAYVIGQTLSTNFPMGTSTPYQSNPGGNVETFVGKISGARPNAVTGRVEGTPLSFTLEQNYPNPFNPATAIRFYLPSTSGIEVAIYSTAGQLVRQLARGKFAGGEHEVVWDGKNEAGMRVASGVYVYKLVAGEFVMQRKLVLMK